LFKGRQTEKEALKKEKKMDNQKREKRKLVWDEKSRGIARNYRKPKT
jgi:hypothetical protein